VWVFFALGMQCCSGVSILLWGGNVALGGEAMLLWGGGNVALGSEMLLWGVILLWGGVSYSGE